MKSDFGPTSPRMGEKIKVGGKKRRSVVYWLEA